MDGCGNWVVFDPSMNHLEINIGTCMKMREAMIPIYSRKLKKGNLQGKKRQK
jgi:hypothetical protein